MTVVVLTGATIVGVLVASARGGGSEGDGGAPQPGVYSYQEARELGLIGPPVPDPSGLPPCPPEVLQRGPAKKIGREELAEVLDDPARCEIDAATGGVIVIVPSFSSDSPND